jgi:hypothetical protein
MRALLLVVSLLPTVAIAQNTPWFEVYGGYQFTHADVGRVQDLADSLTVPAGVPRINVGRNVNMNGFDVSLQENSASWWGGIVDISGSYGTKNIDFSQTAQALGLVPPATSVIAKFQPTFYTATGGPQFTYRKSAHIQPFARIMFGISRSDLQPDSFTGAALATFVPTFKTKDNAFALIGGGGVDYVWKDYVGFRLTGDYIRTYLFNETQNNFRISAGVDFRIGHK